MGIRLVTTFINNITICLISVKYSSGSSISIPLITGGMMYFLKSSLRCILTASLTLGLTKIRRYTLRVGNRKYRYSLENSSFILYRFDLDSVSSSSTEKERLDEWNVSEVQN